MRHDETDGWIFSPEAHLMFDQQGHRSSGWRTGHSVFSLKPADCGYCETHGDEDERTNVHLDDTTYRFDVGAQLDKTGPLIAEANIWIRTGTWFTPQFADEILCSPNYFTDEEQELAREYLRMKGLPSPEASRKVAS